MKLRVLHIIDHLGLGGAQMAVKNITEKTSNNDIDTVVCALRTSPNAVRINATLINLKYGRYNPYTIAAIARLCRQYKIDIIHAHLEKSIVSSMLASFMCGCKVIVHEHGAIFRQGTGCVYRLLLKALRSRANVAIANSQATQIALSKALGRTRESIPVISNFIDFTRFDRSLYDRDETRNVLGIAKDKLVIGFVGRLDYCKGADLLLDAGSILAKESDSYRFVIVGDGREKENLVRRSQELGLENAVTFTGLRTNPAQVMAGFDIAVIPSRREGFGITAVELMRMGVPVIASAVGGLPELIRHENTGILLEKPDSTCIARAISRLAGDNRLRRNLTDNAEQFSRKFDRKTQIKKIEGIYYDLVGRKAGENA